VADTRGSSCCTVALRLQVLGMQIGACDKLLRYPIPLAYTRHTSRFMWAGTRPARSWAGRPLGERGGRLVQGRGVRQNKLTGRRRQLFVLNHLPHHSSSYPGCPQPVLDSTPRALPTVLARGSVQPTPPLAPQPAGLCG
jgi:hypothetical protein